jgi:hypothetical protein
MRRKRLIEAKDYRYFARLSCENPDMPPVDAVQRQLDAYNDRDLERFVAEYSDAIQVFRPPSKEPAISGKAALAAYYAANRFNLPGLRADLVNRIVLGNRVIDHERIWGVRDEPFEVAAVYEVADGKIQTVWFFA